MSLVGGSHSSHLVSPCPNDTHDNPAIVISNTERVVAQYDSLEFHFSNKWVCLSAKPHEINECLPRKIKSRLVLTPQYI